MVYCLIRRNGITIHHPVGGRHNLPCFTNSKQLRKHLTIVGNGNLLYAGTRCCVGYHRAILM